ncbi:MAG: Fis family transcriptional regulator [Nitrospirae bacterium]|jgi:DNA-binding NtrC family response regulator|nr:Fis family transcriptional regulator [Nitrospirota bacterium]
MAFKILIAEDEEITVKHLVNTLKKEGYAVESATNGIDALRKAESDSFDLLIADIKMPGMSGLELLERVREKTPELEVIIVTGYGSIGSAIEAMKKGAIEYLTKPFDLDELLLKVGKIRDRKGLIRENIALKTYLGMDKKVSIIAKSVPMKQILETIESIKDSESNIFFTGETGVGKSLLAKIVHFTSRRQDKPFLSINCATLTEELLASELFGHERGAFTGAVKTKQGLVEIADTGTLFLDEIAEMAPNLQAKLLKVIEEGEFYRVGGTRPIHVDVRFIAATNQDVRGLISTGKFREDLYYRLNVMEIFIPPLRERRDDVEPLAAYFLKKHLPRSNKKITSFSKEAMAVLGNYSYPGNVRELENIVERAIILEKGSVITPESLPQSMSVFQIETLDPSKVRTMDELNKEYAEKVLELYGGNRSKAAEMLGISRTSLWRILKEE